MMRSKEDLATRQENLEQLKKQHGIEWPAQLSATSPAGQASIEGEDKVDKSEGINWFYSTLLWASTSALRVSSPHKAKGQ